MLRKFRPRIDFWHCNGTETGKQQPPKLKHQKPELKLSKISKKS